MKILAISVHSFIYSTAHSLSTVHSFIHSSNKYILSIYYMPVSTVGMGGDRAVCKTNRYPALMESSCEWEGKKVNKKYKRILG